MKIADAAIIGVGPIGIELLIALKKYGISFLQFDKSQIAQIIYDFLPQTNFFSSSERIAIFEGASKWHHTTKKVAGYVKAKDPYDSSENYQIDDYISYLATYDGPFEGKAIDSKGVMSIGLINLSI